ncbi:hypothetical protein [Falsirhodobacter halotolerans]|uniref:hypothetical protein n=1 Tax=Falsirhodobacter halotolerans TaxID=1146892 RepID=UPI001FD24E99|nr:hypothetical protein [Falsirhodobacter halotolerans]MCJ8139470.1 hypothetical protein [Falsirhodobacter halotolerans]
MANKPKPAHVKRDEPKRRENAQAEAEGSAHDPSEFDAMNPAKTKGKPNSDVTEQN